MRRQFFFQLQGRVTPGDLDILQAAFVCAQVWDAFERIEDEKDGAYVGIDLIATVTRHQIIQQRSRIELVDLDHVSDAALCHGRILQCVAKFDHDIVAFQCSNSALFLLLWDNCDLGLLAYYLFKCCDIVRLARVILMIVQVCGLVV